MSGSGDCLSRRTSQRLTCHFTSLPQVSEYNNRAIGRLEEALSQISEGGASVPVNDPPRLQDLMPINTNDFYRYEGSLTTPGCYEVVTWTIFQYPVKVTEAEVRSAAGAPEATGGLTKLS